MKTTNELNFEDHYHMWGIWITNIWIGIAVAFSDSNYSSKFNNLVN